MTPWAYPKYSNPHRRTLPQDLPDLAAGELGMPPETGDRAVWEDTAFMPIGFHRRFPSDSQTTSGMWQGVEMSRLAHEHPSAVSKWLLHGDVPLDLYLWYHSIELYIAVSAIKYHCPACFDHSRFMTTSVAGASRGRGHYNRRRGGKDQGVLGL